VPHEAGNEGPEAHQNEERQTGNARYMPRVRN
jgi:hypothetical protein